MKSIINYAFVAFGSLVALSTPLSVRAADVTSLRPYYRYYDLPGSTGTPPTDFLVPGFPPEVRVIGGGLDPLPIINSAGTFHPVTSLFRVFAPYEYGTYVRALEGAAIGFGGAVQDPCETLRYAKLPLSLDAGFQLTFVRFYYRRSATTGCDQFNIFPEQSPDWLVTDRITLQAPVRRKAIDGSEYEASPMVIVREGVPWMTYYAGYRLGFVAGQSNWDNNNLSKTPVLQTWPTLPNSRDDFELVRLPRPFVEGEVVEYVNEKDFPKAPGGQYFYATSQADQAALDAVPNWWRTGQSFKSGGYVPVCRLYGSAAPGPNTHFYSADAAECASLRANSVLHYEGQPFRASRLIPSTATSPAGCPVATIPLYRGFNNASGKAYDPNHRYVTNRNLLKMLAFFGWVNEGAVMCVPE